MKRDLSRFKKTLLFAAWVSLPVAGAASLLFVPKILGKRGDEKAVAAPQFKAATAVASTQPQISLFDSIDRVKLFMKNEAKLDYSDKYLSQVRLIYVEAQPKKGQAWVYFFSFKEPRLGGDVSIYHYMDGEIVEFTCGP